MLEHIHHEVCVPQRVCGDVRGRVGQWCAHTKRPSAELYTQLNFHTGYYNLINTLDGLLQADFVGHQRTDHCGSPSIGIGGYLCGGVVIVVVV